MTSEKSTVNSEECSSSLADITSPSQLQDVTLDQDVTTYNTMGLRSPTGPMGGRSVKEFEEQLINLRKENFNLKLRIYFLEEKMGTNFTLDKDNAIKKNIELQIEVENLKKELKEKHELLCQAVKAMELEDEEHKKYIANKEEELQICQQELEDLRVHLQETKLDFDGMSVKSDTTGFYSGRGLNCGTPNGELQEKVRILEAELQLEKDNNASLQLVIHQTETIRARYEKLLQEFQEQEQIIQNLRLEIESANTKLHNTNKELIDFQEKLASSQQQNQQLHEQIQSENRKFDDCMQQLNGIRKKYSAAKAELERERKRNERMKMSTEMRIAELENENARNREKIQELRSKLDAAAEEIKRNQSIAVAMSKEQNASTSNTDVRYLSASDSTTPTRVTKKESLHVQISKSSPSTVMRSSSTPEKLNIGELEKFMLTINDNKNIISSNYKNNNTIKIISQQFDALKNDNTTMRNKIISLKSEQMKACDIIKKLIDRQKANQKEITQLEERCEKLEHDLEMKILSSKRIGEEGDAAAAAITSSSSCSFSSTSGVPLKDLITNKNIKAIKSSSSSSSSAPSSDKNEKSSVLGPQSDIEEYKALIAALEAKNDVLVATLNVKEAHLEMALSQMRSGGKNLEEDKENLHGDFESRKQQATRPSDINMSGSENSSSIFFYRKEIEEKDREIERLKVELKKSTSHLQELVNKELWEKNKEIEKMHNKQVNSPEIMKLKKDVSEKNLQLKLLKEKISELSLPPSPKQDSIKSKCSCDFSDKADNYMETIAKLEKDISELKMEIEHSEKLRNEANQVCSLLNSRLEELAIFLDSLLKQKSILGYLGIHKERRLRDIISTSLDLSKSFTMSMMYNPDQSLTQLTNITNILNGSKLQEFTQQSQEYEDDDDDDDDEEESTDNDNDINNKATTALSIIPNNITLTYQSHLHVDDRTTNSDTTNKENVIAALRQQIIKLKNELQLRDNELNRINSVGDTGGELLKNKTAKLQPPTTTSTTLQIQEKNGGDECHSESESWSEPDRIVSRARIGLNATYPLCTRVRKEIMMTDSTEEDSLTSLTAPPLLKRSWSDGKNHHNINNINVLNQHIQELQQEVERKTQQLTAMEARLSGLINREMYEELSDRCNELEIQLHDAEEKKKEMEILVETLRSNVEDLTSKKKYLEETLSEKDKETQNIINELQKENDEAVKLVKEMETQLLKTHEQCLEAERKLDQTREEMMEFEKNLKQEYHEFTIAQIKDVEQRCSEQLSELDIKHKEQIEHLKTEYEQNYVCKEELKDKLLKIEQLIEQLDELKSIVQTYEGQVDQHKRQEQVLENRVKERDEKIENLLTELDSLSNVLKQKSKLEVKISELESTNAELYNKLIKLQQATSTAANRSGGDDGNLNSSMPNIGTSRNIPFKKSYLLQRQYSDQPYNSSEDTTTTTSCLPQNAFAVAAHQQRQAVADLVRMEANSSPDLGIDSDHGRFSSLETNVINRPLLQTLQVTESMSNLLDAHQKEAVISCAGSGEYCCQKTMDIANENSDLKRQLLRMRRALEETANQLNLANQRKKQVEKTICKQIHKTSQVLRKAKANLDSGSESDLVAKNKTDTL